MAAPPAPLTEPVTAADLLRERHAGRDARRGDKIFAGISSGAGVFVLVVIGAIGVFLVVKALPALEDVHGGLGGFLTTKTSNTDAPGHVFGIAALVFGTVVAAAIALLLATPVAIGVALFTTEYANRRLRTPISALTDLLAAVPSVIYGFWGTLYLAPHMTGLGRFLTKHLGWIPLFTNKTGSWTGSLFVAGVVLAIMIIPIITAITREIFKQVPVLEKEAAIGLGATRLEMIRLTVLPFGRAGIVSAAMLGLGRALGETIAVALVLSTRDLVTSHILAPGGNTIAANIALQFNEVTSNGRSGLIAGGLVLFVITFVVNFAARAVIARSGLQERSSV